MSNDNAGAPIRQSKHLQIDSSLNRLETIVGRLGQFISEIQHNEMPDPKNTSDKAETPIMTLAEFLQHTHIRIDALSERIESLTGEARDLLF